MSVDYTGENKGLVSKLGSISIKERSSSHGLGVGRLSNNEALMHLIKSNIGTGMLAMPVAIKNSGLVFGATLIFLVGVIATHCMNILVVCSLKLQQETGASEMDYGQVLELAFQTESNIVRRLGSILRRLCNIFIVVTQLGFCCVYVLFIGKNLQQVFDCQTSIKWNVQVFEALLLVLLLTFVILKDLRILAPFATVANVLVIVCVVIIFQYILRDLPSVAQRNAFSGFSLLPLSFGTAVFAFEAINLVLPITNQMKRPYDYIGWFGVNTMGMTVVIALYVAVGFYGYLKFGDSSDVITLNLPGNDWLYLSVKLMYCVVLYITYGLQFLVPVNVLVPLAERLFARCYYRDSGVQLTRCQHLAVGIVLRVLLLGLTFLLAAVIPYLDLFISLIGALAGSGLTLIFPALIDIVMFYPDGFGPLRWRLLKDVFIVVFGLVGFAFGTYVSIAEIIKCFIDPNSCTKPAPC